MDNEYTYQLVLYDLYCTTMIARARKQDMSAAYATFTDHVLNMCAPAYKAICEQNCFYPKENDNAQDNQNQ